MLHNKPIGCGASGAHAPVPDDQEVVIYTLVSSLHLTMHEEKLFVYFKVNAKMFGQCGPEYNPQVTNVIYIWSTHS